VLAISCIAAHDPVAPVAGLVTAAVSEQVYEPSSKKIVNTQVPKAVTVCPAAAAFWAAVIAAWHSELTFAVSNGPICCEVELAAPSLNRMITFCPGI
jgi:hypothetical protein